MVAVARKVETIIENILPDNRVEYRLLVDGKEVPFAVLRESLEVTSEPDELGFKYLTLTIPVCGEVLVGDFAKKNVSIAVPSMKASVDSPKTRELNDNSNYSITEDGTGSNVVIHV